jgi:hypothetical protein
MAILARMDRLPVYIRKLSNEMELPAAHTPSGEVVGGPSLPSRPGEFHPALRLEASAHSRALDQLLDRLQLDSRRLQAAINDIARENVTAGKMEAVHRDLNRIQLELARLAARVEPTPLNK